jgi:Domain of unknown function (DUF222)
MSLLSCPPSHPVLALVDELDALLGGAAEVDPSFLTTADKAAALVGLSRLGDRLAELRLRVLEAAGDVAAKHGARDAASWVAAEVGLDRRQARADQRLAEALVRRWSGVARAVRAGTMSLAQAEVVVRALDDLPPDLPPGVADRAEAHLVAESGTFTPSELRVMGRRVLDVVAPEVGERHELLLLEREEALAARLTSLTTHRRGDGTTEIRARVADRVADRLLTYLHAFSSPRRTATAEGAGRQRYDVRLGQAFGAFLESVDPGRLPLHGGDATTVVVTVEHEALATGLGTALVGDQPVSAGEARRLACTADVLPMVLGGDSEVLDLGRSRRLFSPAQRKALAVRDRTCRARGCDIPAAWCEAHHAGAPWVAGGATDLADGLLLCSFHHHRAHDRRYVTTRLGERVRFHRRT